MLWTIVIILVIAAFLFGIIVGACANIGELNNRVEKLENTVFANKEEMERMDPDRGWRPIEGNTVWISFDGEKTFHTGTYYHTNENGHLVYIDDKVKDFVTSTIESPRFEYVSKMFSKLGVMRRVSLKGNEGNV